MCSQLGTGDTRQTWFWRTPCCVPHYISESAAVTIPSMSHRLCQMRRRPTEVKCSRYSAFRDFLQANLFYHTSETFWIVYDMKRHQSSMELNFWVLTWKSHSLERQAKMLYAGFNYKIKCLIFLACVIISVSSGSWSRNLLYEMKGSWCSSWWMMMELIIHSMFSWVFSLCLSETKKLVCPSSFALLVDF